MKMDGLVQLMNNLALHSQISTHRKACRPLGTQVILCFQLADAKGLGIYAL
jgi:hypothetical protein